VTSTSKKSKFGFLALLLALAPQAGAQDRSFTKWWPQFQAAVARRDAKTVAQGVGFPLNWEDGPTRNIKTEADLASRFDFYFTTSIKKIIATKKPELLPTGVYSITWKARGNEYSLYFKPQASGFALDGLSEGPP
jgi:hypothetical protein